MSGIVDGSAQLKGRGRSSAQILASLDGTVRAFVRQGAVSHLAIELAGADLFQGLGVWIKGDHALRVHCAVADLQATKGVLRPRVMVVDTDDSVLSMDGTVSLADETLDLRARVMPKDFSPLTLRSPLRVYGRLSSPTVALESETLGLKMAGAVLLGLINPLAALIPLIDPGDSGQAGPSSQASAGCRALADRAGASAARTR